MRVSFEWLSDLASVHDLTPAQAADILTMAGWNVERVTEIDLSEIRVGRIVSQEPHPNSNKPLWVHLVDLGDHTRTIVAGVDNARPGSLVPVALPGTTVPSGTLVRDTKIAGIPARGMLCAADELMLGDDHAGIMLLESGTPGQSLAELIPNDAILEVEVTPNRPDCLSHLGLARELAAATGRILSRDFMPPFTGGAQPPGTELVDVAIEAPDLCRRYIGAVVSGVSVGPAPEWMRRRLRAAGVRPISNVVDVTNYVLLEYGQPLHCFDLSRLRPAGGNGNGPGRVSIRVRRARPGERLLCLDGVERDLDPRMLVIADAQRPVAIAGIIGGEGSSVTETTTEVLLEAANFDGVSVRATSRALKLRTEASGRFEKGISPELAQAGARRAAALLQEVAGGRVHVGWADDYPRPQEPVRVTIRPERMNARLGAHVPPEEMEAILRRLAFQVRVQEDGTWDVLPPVFRLDVSIPEDVVEEIGRIHGYDRIPPTLPGSRRTGWRPIRPALERRLDAARQVLVGAGFSEAVSPALVPGALLEHLGAGERMMRLVNPISDEQDALRTALLPSLVQAAALNRNRGRAAVSLFELARVYLRRPDAPSNQPEEPQRMAVLQTGIDGPEASRAAFFALKGVLERALGALAPVEPAFETAESPLMHPGRTARITLAGTALGHVGEVHPSVLRSLGLEGRAVALEVDLEPVLASRAARRARPLPRYPAVHRDLGVVVPEGVPAQALIESITAAAGDLLEEARAFDEYRGDQVPEGRKSVAFTMTFRSPDRTLTEGEVDARLRAVRDALRRSQEAAFRS
jgi:phenylalanyl-tRNA synthetase beta chain